jgi:hypothetical protein
LVSLSPESILRVTLSVEKNTRRFLSHTSSYCRICRVRSCSLVTSMAKF